MPRSNRFTVALYEPQSTAALDALARHLEAAGLKTSVELPDPIPAAQMKYGIPPFASLHLALRNGKQPSRKLVEQAVDNAHRAIRTTFGTAAVDLNGTLIGSIPNG